MSDYRHGEGPHSVHLLGSGTGKAQILDKNGDICALVFDAPRLAVKFSAVEEMRDALGEVSMLLNCTLKDHADEPWAQRVRAAIAKADGEQVRQGQRR